MRAGACTVQQTLTSEAASVVKLSLSLARRRGHAQVTPLHVAATLLSSRASLLRRACLKSHPHQSSHPLQCRALELCFNVALNRLPTSPSPLIQSQPSLSNALIAALKRAQAHQRRGSIEQQQQQQPFLAIKVELEQLIISILDDPSVSRVMREAGFLSTSVKNNLENSSCSVEIQPSFWPTNFFNSHFNAQLIDSSVEKKEDLRLVLEVMLRKKRRNTVIVGDGLSSTEGLVVELMGKMDRGEVPEELRSVQFVKFQICPVSLKFMKREEVEMKVTDLRRKVGSLAMEGGVVIYVGDLKWAVEESCIREGGILCHYNPIEHVIAEVGRLISDFGSCNNSKVWLIGIANYQTYMRCQMKTPPLEMQWSLQAVAVPSGGLALSLHASSGLDARTNLPQNPTQFVESKLSYAKEEQEMLICCRECTSNFEQEAGIFRSAQKKPQASFGLNDTDDSDKGSSHLPYWLQQHKAENHHKKDYLVELKRKWNRLCQSLHHPRHNQIQMNSSIFNQNGGRTYTYAPSYPWWSSSLQYKQNVFDDSNSISVSELVSKPRTNSTYIDQPKIHQPWSVEISNRAYKQNSSEMSSIPLKKVENNEMKITLALGNPLFSDSVTSKDPMRGTKSLQDFCQELQENIHWQSEIIPAIAEAIHDYKLRVTKGTWLLVPGTDWIGKRRLARTIADSVFGSVDGIFHMNLRRIRENEAKSCTEILSNALRSDPKRVIALEEIDCAEASFIKSLADGYKKGKFEDSHGKEVCTSDAVIIMTTGRAMNFSKDYNEKPNSVIQMKLQFEEYNNYKRKAEWDSPNNGKSPRMGKKEDPLIIDECECSEIEKQQLSRQSSVANLDLNICAEDDEESNTAWSDLTQETAMEPDAPNWFLNSINNRFIFNRNQAQLGQMLEKLRLKLERSFWEAFGREKKGFLWIDDEVLEEILEASSEFVESLFEKWLKDVFQTSVLTVKNGGKDVAAIRMSVKGKNGNSEMGFEGSGLPKTIQVVY